MLQLLALERLKKGSPQPYRWKNHQPRDKRKKAFAEHFKLSKFPFHWHYAPPPHRASLHEKTSTPKLIVYVSPSYLSNTPFSPLSLSNRHRGFFLPDIQDSYLIFFFAPPPFHFPPTDKTLSMICWTTARVKKYLLLSGNCYGKRCHLKARHSNLGKPTNQVLHSPFGRNHQWNTSSEQRNNAQQPHYFPPFTS